MAAHLVYAYAGVEVDFMYYNLLPGNCAELIAPSSYHYVGDIAVPQKIIYAGKEYTVIGIGEKAFQEAAINTLKLPSTIEYIGPRAFYKAKFQNSRNWTLNIPNGVSEIGAEAFRDTYMTRDNVNISVNIPECTKIPVGCFFQSALSSVIIGSGTKEICDNAFGNFKGSVTIGNNVEIIGDGAFSSCKEISTMSLTNVIEIGSDAFNNCANLVTVNFSPNLKSIGNRSFEGCSKLRINEPLPLHIESIGKYAFADINYLSCFSLTPSIQSIGDYAFYNSNLNRFNIYTDFQDFKKKYHCRK